MTDETTTEAVPIARWLQVRLLNKHPAQLQGAILAELLACLLMGQPKEARERLLEQHIRLVRQLVPIREAEYEMFKAEMEKQNAKRN